MVLTDPGLPADMLEDYKGTADDARNITSCGMKCALSRTAARLGVVRLMARSAGSKFLSEQTNRQYRAGVAQPKTVGTMVVIDDTTHSSVVLAPHAVGELNRIIIDLL